MVLKYGTVAKILAAMSCFLAQMIIEGFVAAHYIVYPPLAHKYDVTWTKIAVIGSIINGLWFLLGEFDFIIFLVAEQGRILWPHQNTPSPYLHQVSKVPTS